MTPIVVFRMSKLLASLRGTGLLLVASLLTLWLAHQASGKYGWQMAVLTVASAVVATGLLFRGIYIARNALLRKPLLWTDGVSLVYMAPYEIRVPLADIAGYRFDCGRKRTLDSPKGVTLVMTAGKPRYIPLGMAEATAPLVGFLRHMSGRKLGTRPPFFERS